MRPTRTLALCAVLVLAGCRWPELWKTPTGDTGAYVGRAPTADVLVGQLNENAGRMKSLECQSVNVDARQGNRSISLDALMSCQKPRDFRLEARVLGAPAVDLGSNKDEFWFWVKESDPPALLHASYQDLDRGAAQLPLPIRPDWVVETLGLVERDNNADKYQVVPVAHSNMFDLMENTTAPQGQAMRKVTRFKMPANSNGRWQVAGYFLQEGTNDNKYRTLCAISIDEVQQDRGTGAIVPHKMTLTCPSDKPSEQLSMRLTFDGLKVANAPIDERRAALLFTRPNMAGVPTYDLSRGPDQPTGRVERTGWDRRR
jgi:hypothetical protein